MTHYFCLHQALPSVSNVFVNGTYSDIPSRSSTPLDTEVIVNTPYEDRGSDDASWAEISDPGLRDVFVTKPAGQHIVRIHFGLRN